MTWGPVWTHFLPVGGSLANGRHCSHPSCPSPVDTTTPGGRPRIPAALRQVGERPPRARRALLLPFPDLNEGKVEPDHNPEIELRDLSAHCLAHPHPNGLPRCSLFRHFAPHARRSCTGGGRFFPIARRDGHANHRSI